MLVGRFLPFGDGSGRARVYQRPSARYVPLEESRAD